MTTDVSFRESVVLFSEIARRIAQILFTEAVEMLCGREIELVYNVRKRNIRHRQAVCDVFRPLLNQPSVHGRAELVFEYPPECMHPITTQFRQFFRIVGFAVVCHYKVLERHLLVGHRVEERLQLFCFIIAGEHPYQFLVLQFPQIVVVRFVREIGNDSADKDLQGLRDGQFAAIDFRPEVPMRVEVGKDALFILTDRIVELMYQQRDIAQCHAAALTPTRDEHHFSGTQDFVMEQRAAIPCVPRATEYQVVDIRVIVVNRRAYRVVFHFKPAINRILIAEHWPMFILHIHYLCSTYNHNAYLIQCPHRQRDE